MGGSILWPDKTKADGCDVMEIDSVWCRIFGRSFFLPLHSDGLSASAGGFGVLSPDFQSPLVPQTSVAPDLEEAFDVLSELGFEDVGGDLEILALLVVSLSVEEPAGDAVALGVCDKIGDGIALGLGELSGPETGVEAEDLTDEEAEASADSLDLVEGEGDGALAVDVGVQDTVDVLERVLRVFDDQRHLWLKIINILINIPLIPINTPLPTIKWQQIAQKLCLLGCLSFPYMMVISPSQIPMWTIKRNLLARSGSIFPFMHEAQQQSKQLMQEGSNAGNICQDCGLHFETASQLLNHKRRFCVNSGYDNLQGLAKIEFNGVALTHQPKVGHKNYLQHYGANSLTRIDQYDSLSAGNLEREMKNVHRFKRQLEGVQKYQRPEVESRVVSSKGSVGSRSAALAQSRNNYLLQESQLQEDLKRYEKAPKEEAISPPTFIDQLNMRNHTVLDKSNSSLGRMAVKDRVEYARVKLDELNEIKQLYVKNGGTKNEFKTNVDKMIEFYKKFLKENEEKQREDGPYLNTSQEIIESRASTPILKLRELNEDQLPLSRRRNKQSAAKEKPMERSKANQNQNSINPNQPFMNGFAYGQPPFIMMPYAPPSVSSVPSDSMRFLERMMELKSEENQRLMEILLQDKRRGNQPQQPTIITVPQYGTYPSGLPLTSNPPAEPKQAKPKGSINVDDDYQFKKSMIDDLISEEKVLLAMQQEELDEMKLLSQLPKDLQEVKIKSIIKASETRHRVEKEILKQKMDRLAYQEQNQSFEENRKLGNDRWAGEERKKLLENQMNQYVNNFEEEFNTDPPS